MSIFAVNTALIVSIVRVRERRNNLFNQIIVLHSLGNLVNGVIDLPFYSASIIFGYWPFGPLACYAWSTLDYSINTIIISHMLMLTWARYSSVFTPNTYKEQWVNKHPFLTSALVWLVTLGANAALGKFFLLDVADQFYVCQFAFVPHYLLAFVQFVQILLPLAFITGFTLCIMWHVEKMTKKSSKMRAARIRAAAARRQTIGEISLTMTAASPTAGTNTTANGSTSRRAQSRCAAFFCCMLSAQQQLTVILVAFVGQWLPICAIFFAESFCQCVPTEVVNVTYLFSYIVSFTDPLLVLLLNTQFKFRNTGSVSAIL